MRPVRLIIVVLLGLSVTANPARAATAPPPVVLTDVSHALEGRMLVITGRVTNAGSAPTAPLVIDATGYSSSGDLASTGSDGIPWPMAPGQTERFSIGLPLGRTLIREYVVQVSRVRAPVPYSSARRTVAVAMYREFLRTLVELRGDLFKGFLTVRADGPGLPVAQVTAEASVLVFNPLLDGFQPLRLTLDLDLNRFTTVFVGSPHAFLISLRLVDLRLNAGWSD
ncbi:MAG: hypothetical protein QN141_13900 [Armatimonadota bacterium]|nr:hypothetical protein [Armatimonadota bacterium]MDR7452441.1 hypothetical protein [Armatimonadota bacterium]MDR7466179.1 hypothetical protein [Armatimonadota bacterium]MDR7495138.1 hypothetical protein [Armatimonadota bacterium]MDR7505792.1 hypothetical protein [Armatimonadota bacterium]